MNLQLDDAISIDEAHNIENYYRDTAAFQLTFDELCPTMQNSIRMLLQAWKSVGQFEVLHVWEVK
jgi:Rad3-related DNA helicase